MKKILFLSIVTSYALATNVGVSILPQEMIVKKLLPDAKVTVLMPAGADPHTYEPKPAQMIELSKAKVFLGIGVEVEDVWLKRLAENTNIKIAHTNEGIKKNKYSQIELDEHHHHNHNDDVYNGKFDDKDVKNRDLSDWYGDWKSIYPYALDGSLDDFFELKANASENKTKDYYKNYYLDGYKTDVEKIIINKDGMEFIKNGISKKSQYKYVGYKILTYESGKKGVRYLFEATQNNGTPKFVQFSDHNIAPTKDLEHFHIFFGDESQEKLLEEMINWPTYYPKNMNIDEIKEDLIHHIEHKKDDKHNHHDHHENHHEHNHDKDDGHEGHHHDHSGLDVHIWTDPILLKQIAQNSANALKEAMPENTKEIDINLEKFQKELDELNLKLYDLTKDLKTKGFVSAHPSWGYFANRYNLSEYTVEFEGKEIKANKLAKIVEAAKDKKICLVLKAPQFSDKLINVIHKESGLKIVQIDPLAPNFLEELIKFAKILKDNCSN
ncbi:metal ABC transporter solute-binding protein, Zn/Mn family [Campylobacter sp. MG1]|uniref:metal ABC transporter solute-binding protein, Zn/Mn family n=1 Tax=Campylobacter sp. MG1 TaxID=2976332 RepID=UPI00226D3DD1|nr:ZinT/AdcA family metal-binding protein [Campylobacter sp. MG1]